MGKKALKTKSGKKKAKGRSLKLEKVVLKSEISVWPGCTWPVSTWPGITWAGLNPGRAAPWPTDKMRQVEKYRLG